MVMSECALMEKWYDIGEEIELKKNKAHNIDVVVDRLVIKEGIRSRVIDSLETSLRISRRLCNN